jgi:hypothetical protein
MRLANRYAETPDANMKSPAEIGVACNGLPFDQKLVQDANGIYERPDRNAVRQPGKETAIGSDQKDSAESLLNVQLRFEHS